MQLVALDRLAAVALARSFEMAFHGRGALMPVIALWEMVRYGRLVLRVPAAAGQVIIY